MPPHGRRLSRERMLPKVMEIGTSVPNNAVERASMMGAPSENPTERPALPIIESFP